MKTLCIAAAALAAGLGAAAVDFNQDIRPILSDNCFQCHGPDLQKSGLRLDDPVSGIEIKALVPGNPAASELIRRVLAKDPADRMPPPKSNLSLDPKEIDLLREWIAEGAEYSTHWAFTTIPPAQVPEVADPKNWIRNPIDTFVLRRLQTEGLFPQPEAQPETLLRRITLALTGLPPTIAEMDAYLAAPSESRYGESIATLMRRPAYGERMAMDWLDVARYADTYGYQDDKENRVWPWRDWVIGAFNKNLPYDDFIREQLAGDLLDSPTQDQILATAFNRLHRQTNEGGVVEEEFLVEYAADRTQTFGTAFLGLTVDCARCHTHKFDPITHHEYYSLFAFFNNIDESGMYSHFTDSTPTPNIRLYETGQREQHEELREKIRDAEARLEAARALAMNEAESVEFALPEPVLHWSFDGKDAQPDAKVGGGTEFVEGVHGKAVAFNGDNGVSAEDGPLFERSFPLSVAFWMKRADVGGLQVVCHQSKAVLDAGSRGWEIFLEDGHVVFGMSHFYPGNAIRLRSTAPFPPGEWQHFAVTYDGSSRAEGVTLYLDGAPFPTQVIRDNLYDTILYKRLGKQVQLTLGERFRDVGFKDGALDDLRVYDVTLLPSEVARLHDPEAPLDESSYAAYFAERVSMPVAESAVALQIARVKEQAFAAKLREVMTMREKPGTPEAFLLERGAYDARADKVTPGTPVEVLPFPEDLPRNRLGLAAWLLRRDNPLTARVAVNRYWKLFFGTGLVETQENFGSQGTPPSHPELLDYLAAWFMDNDWDVQALCALIADSATYRQSSDAPTALLAEDPANRLLARGPRQRMGAEQIRDAALAASGLLVRSIGGPSVRPYQPEGLWRESSNVSYTPGTGDDLYRRSMYTFWKRTVPPPALTTFDATNREVCVARREVTTTPLQALVLLNDPQFVEAARILAADITARHSDPAPRLQEAYRRLIGRRPSDFEAELLLATYDEQRAFFTSKDSAKEFLSVGEKPLPESLDYSDCAATAAVVQAIMGLDAFQVQL